MSPEEAVLTAAALTQQWLDKPRKCSRCEFAGKVRDFPLTTARGRLVARSWCHACTTAFYRGVKAKKKALQRDAREDRIEIIRQRHEALKTKAQRQPQPGLARAPTKGSGANLSACDSQADFVNSDQCE